MTHRTVVRLLQVCVFLSGGVALILEAVYQKYLATLIGATTPASTIVLATYFVGLTLGAMVCPKTTRRVNYRLAFLELFIAAWSAILSLFFYASYESLAGLLTAWSGSAFSLGFARWLIAAVWILPPTMAMGAHLPTLGAFLEERGLATPGTLTRLYALNTAGACFFTFAAPFLLFHTLGLEGTLLLSSGIGVLVAAALFFGLRPAKAAEAPASAASPEAPAPAPTPSPAPAGSLRWPFALAFLSGFVFFALEVLWSHLIASVLGASTYSFSILLGVVLLALALGGRQVERAAPKDLGEVKSFLRTTLASLALGLPLTVLFWPFAGRVLAVIGGQALKLESFWAGELLKLGIAYLLIKPIATSAGTIFPLTFHGYSHGHAPTGRQLGSLYALNTVGCVAGALIGGFAMVPLLGAEKSFRLIWVLVLALWAFLTFERRGEERSEPISRQAYGMVLVGIALVALPNPWNKLELTGGYGVYFSGHIQPGSQLRFFHEDQHTGFTTVVDQPVPNAFLGTDSTRFLYTNGKFEADDFTQMPAQCAFGLMPSLFSTKRGPALIIGLGGGQTAGTTWASGYRDLDICEISPGNIEATRTYFAHINNDVLNKPGVNLIFEDGRNHLLRTNKTYDLISIEITSVWFAGASNLYSKEFYQLVKRRLAPDGLFEQWIQLHHLTPNEIATVFATLASEFKDVEVWLGGEQAVILASQTPMSFNAEGWKAFRASPDLELERVVFDTLMGGGDLEKFHQMHILTDAQVREVVRRTPHVVDSDRTKWIEFHTPRYYLSRRDHALENVRYFASIAKDVPAAPLPPPATPVADGQP